MFSSNRQRMGAKRQAWVSEGELVPARRLADAWGVKALALRAAEKRGEIFSVVVDRRRYYPCEFLSLDRGDVATVCRLLSPLDSIEKLFFWKRRHGTLQGRTVLGALGTKGDSSRLECVTQLARAATAQARADAEMSHRPTCPPTVMTSDDDFDLEPALRRLRQLGLEDGDVAFEYWHHVSKRLRSVPELRARIAELEHELARRIAKN